MTKHVFCLSVWVIFAMTASAQTTPQPASGNDVISRPAGSYSPTAAPVDNQTRPSGYNTVQAGNTYNQQDTGGVLFSNRVGQVFSAKDLAYQLQNLRNAVDQTLPILSAFNETYSNSNIGERQTIGGALSGIVSDVLHRNQPSTQPATGQGSTASNLLAVLHGLLNTNPPSSSSAPPSDPRDLISLQNNLQPVVAVLQHLNVNTSSNQIAPSYPYSGVTPTGR